MQAILYIPRSGDIGPTQHGGLSDDMALAMGRTMAYTLSEECQEYVIVTLSDGSIRTFAVDWLSDELRCGRVGRVQ